MTPFNESDITQAAAQASIPPAILYGMVRQAGVSSTLGLPEATMTAYGITPQEIDKDPALALSLTARVLAQQYKKTGDWEQALSKTLAGDGTASQASTSSIGGQVQAILGWAATNPEYGLTGYQPNDPQAAYDTSQGFGQQLQLMVTLGGVVDSGTAQQYNNRVQSALQGLGNIPFRPNPSVAQAMTDVMKRANIPVTQANLAFLETMARGEGMDPRTYNWLASTQGQGGNFNNLASGGHVKTYGSYQEGVAETAATLLNGNYNRMVQLMRQGSDLHTLAGDPGVQNELQTWQGGSHEDVNNLLKLANIPGKMIQPQPQGQTQDAKETAASPDEVGQFATQLQDHNVDPSKFIQDFPWLASQRRRLLQEKMTSIEDYAQVAQLPKDAMLQHLLVQPHAQYPGLTVGQMEKARGSAELLSVLHNQRMPASAEVARLAQSGAGWNEMNNYFQAQAAARKTSTQPQQGGKVVNMPQQRQQQTA